MMKPAYGGKIEAPTLSIPAVGSPDLQSSRSGTEEREYKGEMRCGMAQADRRGYI
jgi:hypothetical protein